MKDSKPFFVAGMGLWTAVTLAGSIVVLFHNPITKAFTAQPQHPSIPVRVFLFSAMVIVLGTIGGGLWGGGTAWMMGRRLKPLVKRSGLSWGSTVLSAGIILYFSQIPGAAFEQANDFSRYDIHFFFTVAFALVVGAAARTNTRNLTAELGYDDLKKEVGRKSGLAASGAFLVTSLVLLFGLGWEVGRPGYFAGYRYSMLVIMHWCNFGAALAGGLTMGWLLARGWLTEKRFTLTVKQMKGQLDSAS